MQKSIRFGVVLLAFCAAIAANGVELPHVFGDNMVLQRAADGVWVSANARIDGTSVVLAADEVDNPKAVRFAAYNGSTPNLVKGSGLPAGPFRLGEKLKIDDAESLKELKGMTCVQRFDIPAASDLSVK